MARDDERRRGPERGDRREPRGRYSSEIARRSARGDDRSGTDDEYRDYDDDYERPRAYRDAYSERQSGPYRSPTTGQPISEDEYRQEAHWHRSRPYTGFSGRVSEFGYEDPGWGVPQMGRTGGPTRSRYAPPGAGFRGMGPRHYTRSDERIREDVCDELSDDGEVDARDIDIEVKDATVTLTGTVPERYMKHRAEDISDDCRGVKDVENRIRVQRNDSGEQHSSPERTPNT